MSWFLKALFAVVLIVFAIDAKSWIGRIWGVALDEPKSRWADVVEGREALYGQAAAAAAEKAAAAASKEPYKLALGGWFFEKGDAVLTRQALCELIGVRYTVLVVAPCDGVLETVYGPTGLTITDGTVVAQIRPTVKPGSIERAPKLVDVGAVRPPKEFESPIPIAVLPLAEDVERRASSAVEAAFLRNEWRVQARAAFLEAMAEQDLRALVEGLWSRISPKDLYTKQGVDRLVYGRVDSVVFPTQDRCEVRISIRGMRKDGELLFSVEGEGSAGPEPSIQGWVREHPWRAAGIALFVAWLLLALFTRGKVVPYVDRAKQESMDRAAFEASRKVSGAAQEVITDLRRLQGDAANRGRPIIARQLGEQVDRLDQIRRRLETTSRDQDRLIAASGLHAEELVRSVGEAVRRFPAGGDEVSEQAAVDDIARSIEALRRAVHQNTNI
jgi:pyruvate/2-oxoglutarate dehydrogenase complex dihydrolipoamide acyltransferase (E2) component